MDAHLEHASPTVPAGAAFVMPRPSTAWAGASALWITVAGWAAAAERRYGQSWVLTPDAVASAEETLLYTVPRGEASSGPHPLRKVLPTEAVTLIKDIREWQRRRRFKSLDSETPWGARDLAFVWEQHDIFAGPGASIAQEAGVPFVSFVHAPQVWEAARWGVRRPGWGAWIEKLSEGPSLRRADVVACVSEEVGNEVLRFGVDPARVLVTPMSVDASRFKPSVDGDAIRQQWGLADKYVFGWTGSFRSFHGLDIALRAFAALHQQVPDVAFMLVGDGAERSQLQDLVTSLGIEDAVVFTGAVSHLDIPQHVAAMDAAVVVARDGDTFHYSPLKLREYMLCEKPVVVPAAGEMRRVLTDGVNAVFYEPGSQAGLHRAFGVYANDRERARRIGVEGARVMAESGTWDAQVGRLMDTLAELRS